MSELRYALRQLARYPGFAAVVVLTLALGIGASTTIFSVVNGVLLRPLPYPDADRIVVLWESNPDRGWVRARVAPANLLDWRDRSVSFDAVAAHSTWDGGFILGGAGGDAEFVTGSYVFGDLFRTLGVAPALGRGFTEDEAWEGSGAPVVIGHDVWHRRFAGDSAIVGRRVMVDGEPRTVVGVMPAGFAFPRSDTEVWMPFGWSLASREAVWFRRAHFIQGVARLAPGTSLDRARSDIARIAAQLEVDHPETNRNMGAGLTPLHEWIVGDVRGTLLLVLGAVGLLLLIACANVANLFLSRTVDRRRELAVRTALGAGRGRVGRQLLAESALLALGGGALGVALATLGTDAVVAMAVSDLPRLGEVRVDGAVLAFALAATGATALLFGVGPALFGSSVPGTAALSEGGRAGSARRGAARVRRGLVVAQLALAVLLVTAAGLMLRTLRELASVDPGFDAEGVVAATIRLPTGKYVDDASVLGFHRALLERLRALPGVEAVGSTDALPLQGSGWTSDFAIEGRAPLERGADFNRRIVSPGYFGAMGVQLVRGRTFAEGDDDRALPVALVNETLASLYFPDADPVGRRIAFEREPGPDEPWYTIVGVVGTERLEGLGEVREWPEVFLPAWQQPSQLIRVVVRSSTRPEAQGSALRGVVHALDPDVAIADVRPMDAVVGAAMARERFLSIVFGTFAMLSLALAAVGVYGVMAYTVSSRKREFGVRMAIGAEPGTILHLVLRQGMALGLVGTVLGAVAALAATRLMRGLLFRVSPMDPITLGTVVAILTGVALVACLIPALRATRIEPMEALRHE